jgi:hypothetical protein
LRTGLKLKERFRPDIYSFYEGMRISDLVSADGLKEDAYKSKILRVKGDLTNEIVNVDLEQT